MTRVWTNACVTWIWTKEHKLFLHPTRLVGPQRVKCPILIYNRIKIKCLFGEGAGWYGAFSLQSESKVM